MYVGLFYKQLSCANHFFSQINSRELVREQKNMACEVFYVAREVKSMAREVFSVAWDGMNCVEERNLYIYAR